MVIQIFVLFFLLDIHACQYAILRYLAMKKLGSLRRNHYAAISIQKLTRGLIVKRQYMEDIKGEKQR